MEFKKVTIMSILVSLRLDNIEPWIVSVLCSVESPEFRGMPLKNNYPIHKFRSALKAQAYQK